MDRRKCDLDEAGFVLVEEAFPPERCVEVTALLAERNIAGAGSRTLLAEPWCLDLATLLGAHDWIAPLLPGGAIPVQCTLFDKSAGSNWSVVLHQDLSIPVESRIDSEECMGWCEKEGMVFVQPPADVLEQMLAVRLHLDDCDAGTGPLRVVPGSHRHGKLNHADVARLRSERGETPCLSPRGGALILRPLLLHASSKSMGSSRRRVLHFLYGPPTLPGGLEWPRSGGQ